MAQNEFFSNLQRLCHSDHQQCKVLLDALCRMMAQAGVEQVDVTLPGLGTFTSHKHPEYIQEDPKTGQQTLFPPRITYKMIGEDLRASSELLERQFAEHAKVTPDVASAFLSALVQTIFADLSAGREVNVPGLGLFRNLITHQGDFQRIHYTPDEKMRQLVNAPFSFFEPVVVTNTPAPVLVSEPEPEPAPVPSASPEGLLAPVPSAPVLEPASAPVFEPEPAPVPSPSGEGPSASPSSPVSEEGSPIPPFELYERQRSSRRKLYALLASLLLILCGALVWFVFSLERQDEDPVLIAHRPSAPVPSASLEAPSSPEPAPVPSASSEGPSSPEPAPVPSASPEGPSSLEPAAEAAPEPSVAPVPSPSGEGPSVAPSAPSKPASDKLQNPDGSFKTYTLQPGDRLTLVALQFFGSKWFWPYIFEVNRDKLKSPGLVQAGMTIYLPNPAVFGIDANDPESIRRAKNAGAKYSD